MSKRIKKMILTQEELFKIKEFGIRRFHEASSFKDMSNSDIQSYLILAGLEDFLHSLKIDPPFKVILKETK